MVQKKRVKRPVLDRTEPDRRWSGVARPAGSPREARVTESAAPAPDGRAAVGRSARAASYDAVNSAYRVVDEYMRQGQRMAEEFWLPVMGGENGPIRDASKVLERFMRAAGDMGMAWVEMMNPAGALPSASSQSPRGTAGPFTAGQQARGPEGSPEPSGRPSPGRLSVSVQSTRPVELSVDLHGAVHETDLVLKELTPVDRLLPPIQDIALEPVGADGRVTICVRVPDGQAPGVYNGILLERGTSRPKGTVSLSIR
jgi:hypothetical protein